MKNLIEQIKLAETNGFYQYANYLRQKLERMDS